MPITPPKPSAPSAGQKPPQAPGPVALRLKKGELLFSEGDTSRSMYVLKSGMIRIFKKKGDSSIEIDTIRSGQILGELAFLDGNPRSASGEALTECELAEISAATFQAIVSQLPEWLKLLLKTVVGRLRTASTRIRQLESASTAFDYSEKDGKRSAHYVFLSPPDVLKLATALLLVATRNGTKVERGIEIKTATLQKYSNPILGVPVAKMSTFVDSLAQTGLIALGDDRGADMIWVQDIDTLEKFISYYNEEALLEPAKRHDLSLRGFYIMNLIVKHLAKYPENPETGTSEINLAQILAAEKSALAGKDPFRLDEFPELAKLGYATNVEIKNTELIVTSIKTKYFINAHKMQKIVMAIHIANEQKRKGSLGGKAA